MRRPVLYKENGFKKRETAQELIQWLEKNPPSVMTVVKKEKKKEKKNPPLLFNLAELQNECSKRFKLVQIPRCKLHRNCMRRN